jgi:hypothetical protein
MFPFVISPMTYSISHNPVHTEDENLLPFS